MDILLAISKSTILTKNATCLNKLLALSAENFMNHLTYITFIRNVRRSWLCQSFIFGMTGQKTKKCIIWTLPPRSFINYY